MNNVAYLIDNITDFGKFLTFCIQNDFSVFRTFWDDREKGKRCFHLSYSDKLVYYSDISFYKSKGYKILRPSFELNSYSEYYVFSDFDLIYQPTEVIE